jgi:transposase, IS5 family
MAGIAILKHMHNLSDEGLCERWLENPYYQLFRGEEFFQRRLPFDRSSMTRWRQRMGEDKLVALLQESLSVAARTDTRPNPRTSPTSSPIPRCSRRRWRSRRTPS